MTPRPPFRYPDERREDVRRAIRLEWWTLFFLLTIVVAMYLTLGGSQAMRSAWIEDLLGFVPAIAFLVSERVARKAPTRRFPFGFHRAERSYAEFWVTSRIRRRFFSQPWSPRRRLGT